MRKYIGCVCAFLILLGLCTSARADTVTFGESSYDTASVSIDLQDNRVTDWDAFYDFLSAFTGLEHVDMFASPVQRAQIEELEARFPGIEFGWTIQFYEHEVRTDQTAFSTLHMSNARTHGDIDISLVRYCKNLRALDFGHNAVKDISFLYDLPELRVLIIACNQVEDITPIGSLKNLEYLELFTNRIKDISPLTGLEHLMDLNISYNYIEDISPIFTLPNLKRLWTCRSINRGSNVSLSWAQIGEIKEAFPDIELNNVSNPTGGTWREHPHFEVIHTFFRTGVYVPFEDSFDVERKISITSVEELPMEESTESPEVTVPPVITPEATSEPTSTPEPEKKRITIEIKR
ncbi:MAG: leucine-rich repeat domain-containing protein [Clostridia bacterium]|nr:leucine-rich repeat domain-containing protein [Clostridia bacterium]